ncbi:uncharacterized protein [Amphiura filiformis]|uniref:uncharacterized protein n=1 Tax=Amphiura filiformis TaxID=82378 RepID=UPI003B22605D
MLMYYVCSVFCKPFVALKRHELVCLRYTCVCLSYETIDTDIIDKSHDPCIKIQSCCMYPVHTYPVYTAIFSSITLSWITLKVILLIQTTALLLIIRAGDVERNPGPRQPKYPCGECHKACTDYKGAKASILCDECSTWFHVECVHISETVLASLARSDLPWECTNCGLPNVSASLFDSTTLDNSLSESDVFESTKRSLSTSSSSSSEPGSPNAQSSPSKTSMHSSSKPSNSTTNLRSLTINFQSIYRKKEVLWSLIDAVKPDVISGCETWLKPAITHGEILPPDYKLYRKDRHDGYGGVLLAVHSSLTSYQLETNSDAEFVAAKILNGKEKPLVIGALYRPTNNSQEYIDSLNKTIEDLCVSNPECAIWSSGDINLPDIEWSTDQVIGHQYPKSLNESFLQTLSRTGLEQLVDFPTRGDNTLDIVITNRPSLVNRCEGMPGLSDHDIVYVDLNIQASRSKPVKRKIFLWKRADLDAIHSATKTWADSFVSRYSTSTPVEILATEVEDQLEKILNDEPGGNKRLGALIKAKRCDQTGTAPLRDGNILHSDPKTKASILNRHFASVFTDDKSTTLPDLGPSPHPSMDRITVNIQGVIKLLQNLKPHKATGPDGIPARLLRETALEIAPAITLLFQASLDQGKVPASWKKASVVPIFKKGDRSLAANYRPISLTSILCKLCEHILHHAMIGHFSKHQILTDAQHGFRKKRSCDTQLITVV